MDKQPFIHVTYTKLIPFIILLLRALERIYEEHMVRNSFLLWFHNNGAVIDHVYYLYLQAGVLPPPPPWVPEQDITEGAIRYDAVVHSLHFFKSRQVHYPIFHRTFSDPSPPQRLLMDSISLFVTTMKGSLRVGTIRNCTLTIPFRTDVFNFLFNGKGNMINGKKAKSYVESDFNTQLFPSNWFVYYDRLGNGCKLDFPVYMYSHIKYAPQTYIRTSTTLALQQRDFTEIVTVTVVKCRCWFCCLFMSISSVNAQLPKMLFPWSTWMSEDNERKREIERKRERDYVISSKHPLK